MPNILDIYGDKSMRGLVSMLRDYPEYEDHLRGLELDYDEGDALPETAFAYPEERAYPINNKQMAILSALYRNALPPEEEVPEYVDENLKKASYLYDFELPKKKVEEKKSEKKASISEDDYLIPALKKFPVRNKREADFIQKVIVKNAHVMGYDSLMEACSNLVEKYASYQAEIEDINPVIYKYAGLTLSNRDTLEAAILRRKDFCEQKFHAPYEKLAETIYQMDFNRYNLLKVASTLEEMDKVASLRHLYDKHLLNPMESVFNTEKIYREKKANEDLFSPNHAERVTKDQIMNLLGKDILDEVLTNDSLDREKMSAVINSLPTEMLKDFVERI